MSNFERDMANTMLDAADARIASLEADKADLLRVLGVADEKIRSGEDARGQYIRENAALEARFVSLEGELARARSAIAHDTEATRRIAALEARCRELEAALRDCYARWQWFIQPETPEPPVFDMERIRKLLTASETKTVVCGVCNVPMTEHEPGKWHHTGECSETETAGEQTKKLMARNDTGLMGTEIEWPQPDDYKETGAKP